jgi:hypothetical protein
MISLARQISRMQLTIAGERDLLEKREIMARAGRWPEGDLMMKRQEITDNEAILKTLRWLEANEAAIRAAAEGKG